MRRGPLSLQLQQSSLSRFNWVLDYLILTLPKTPLPSRTRAQIRSRIVSSISAYYQQESDSALWRLLMQCHFSAPSATPVALAASAGLAVPAAPAVRPGVRKAGLVVVAVV